MPQVLAVSGAIDWTQVLVVVLPYLIGHAFGALQMWLRVRADVELGRSMRPPKGPGTS